MAPQPRSALVLVRGLEKLVRCVSCCELTGSSDVCLGPSSSFATCFVSAPSFSLKGKKSAPVSPLHIEGCPKAGFAPAQSSIPTSSAQDLPTDIQNRATVEKTQQPNLPPLEKPTTYITNFIPNSLILHPPTLSIPEDRLHPALSDRS